MSIVMMMNVFLIPIKESILIIIPCEIHNFALSDELYYYVALYTHSKVKKIAIKFDLHIFNKNRQK